MKKYISALFPFSLFLFCIGLTTAVFSQEKNVEYPEGWGENQHLQERAAYWRNIEMSGPDTNIGEARQRGYQQYISIPRPKAMMIQSSTAWEQVGGAQCQVVQTSHGPVLGAPSVS